MVHRKDLSRLTLVIPTYTRQAYALRNMRYWSGKGPVVHVLDGSAEAIREENLQVLGSNIHYHHLPVGINDRLSFVLDVIDTEYTAFLSDDEFFISSALVACMAELDAERDMVACGGRCMSFSPSPYRIVGAAVYTSQANYSIGMSDPVARMVFHMHPYTPSTIYSVLRSAAWSKIVRVMVQKEFPVYAMGELQFELGACYLGKSKVIQNLMWMRSHENPQLVGTSSSLNPENPIWDWWRDPHTLNQRSEFLDIMSKGLSSSPAEISVVRNGVIGAIDAYINAYGGGAPKGADRYLRALKKRIPPEVKNAIKKLLYRNCYLTEESNTVMDVAKAMAATGVSVDFQELANIESLVADFHKNRVVS